ncbi:MAG: hypothetical protein WB729_11225 [Candidatus Sulfotelmatobacter sp.]
MQSSDLDSIVEQSLRSFYEDICSLEWCGRENEMVNLYALGHLAKQCVPGTILSELTQLGIEVAVRQLPPDDEHRGRRQTVRKDLVIWPSARMTLWKSDVPHNEPLAIMEWKVNHIFNHAVHQENRREHLLDVRWLQETSNRLCGRDFLGYAVLIESMGTAKKLSCVRVHGSQNATWIRIP